MKCKKIVETNSVYNLSKILEPSRIQIFEATTEFPEFISISYRARAIAFDDLCKCKFCGKTHGKLGKEFCNATCRSKFVNPREKVLDNRINKMIQRGEDQCKDLIEGEDYLVCKICGCKSLELSNHIKVHNITSSEYKKQFNINSVKTEKQRMQMKGENNPAFNHGGRLSAWSKNFKNGYDEAKHEQFKKDQSLFMKENPGAFSRASYDSEEEYIKSQTRNLDWFIEKYGEDEGVFRHSEKTRKWIHTLSLKTNDEKAEINRKKIFKKGMISNLEKEIVEMIKNEGIDIEHQFRIRNHIKWYVYDIKKDNKIIEVNGDFWHANPLKYKENDVVFKGKTAKDLWEKDEVKINFANEHGFVVLTIWENDFRTNPQQEIEKCLNFLTR
jgi:hypothetical protein